MSTATTNVTCSRCKKSYWVPPVLQGKKIKCKQCGQTIPIPMQVQVAQATGSKKAKPAVTTPVAAVEAEKKPEPATPATSAEAGKGQSAQEWGPITSYQLTGTKDPARCPHCAHEMEEGEIVCLNCGYNTVTRERLPNLVLEPNTGQDYFIHLAPGFGALFMCLLSIFWAQMIFTHTPYLAFLDWSFYDSDNKAIPVYMFMFLLLDIWGFGFFAVKRLIFNYTPPDRIKHLELEDREED